jgi:hypothetical protein
LPNDFGSARSCPGSGGVHDSAGHSKPNARLGQSAGKNSVVAAIVIQGKMPILKTK